MINKQPKTVIFYHKNCQDGFMSALVHKVFVKVNALKPSDYEYVALNYGEEIKTDVKNCIVFMLDVTVKPEVFDGLLQQALCIKVLDHHESAMKDYSDAFTANSKDAIGPYKKLAAFKDCCLCEQNEEQTTYRGGVDPHYSEEQDYLLHPNRFFSVVFNHGGLSGATLALREFKIHNESISERMKHLCTRITDRDIWKFEYEDTKAVYEVVSGFQFDFEKAIDFIFNTSDDEFQTAIKEGAIRVKMRDELAAGYASKAETLNILGYDVPCVNVPSNISSYVGALLSVGKPFALMYVLNSNEAFLSFRSNQETGVDLIPIAKHFGGGGHKNAAGAHLSTEDFFRLIYKK